jgi:hypothetical protein
LNARLRDDYVYEGGAIKLTPHEAGFQAILELRGDTSGIRHQFGEVIKKDVRQRYP